MACLCYVVDIRHSVFLMLVKSLACYIQLALIMLIVTHRLTVEYVKSYCALIEFDLVAFSIKYLLAL